MAIRERLATADPANAEHRRTSGDQPRPARKPTPGWRQRHREAALPHRNSSRVLRLHSAGLLAAVAAQRRRLLAGQYAAATGEPGKVAQRFKLGSARPRRWRAAFPVRSPQAGSVAQGDPGVRQKRVEPAADRVESRPVARSSGRQPVTARPRARTPWPRRRGGPAACASRGPCGAGPSAATGTSPPAGWRW
jgi:hypothetical protein